MKVTLRSLSKYFGEVKAVDDLDLTISSGEFVALLGPSGCGKTTTLYLLAGLYRPTGGEIRFGDRLVNSLKPQERRIGLVFQSYALYPHMTVFDNIAFPLSLNRTPREETERRVREVAEMVEIESLLRRRPGQLSGGQQQRVALCRALVKKPDLLLLDEPLSNLDAKLRMSMRGEIKRLQRELKLTSVLVTHDQVEATTMADRVALMERGRLEAYDRPVVLYQEPPTQFTAGFIGELPMNFAEAECDGDGGLRSPALGMTRPARAGGLASGVPPGPYMLGFRPEDVDIAQEGGDLEGRIRVIEPMGRQVLYELLAGETVVRALGVETPLLEPDMTVNLSIRWQAAHLFHPESGKRVGAQAAAQARPLDGVPGAEEAASGG